MNQNVMIIVLMFVIIVPLKLLLLMDLNFNIRWAVLVYDLQSEILIFIWPFQKFIKEDTSIMSHGT